MESKTEVHTAKYVANLYLTEIAVQPEKVSTVVADNVFNMCAACNIIKEMNPYLVTFSNLLAKDLAKIKVNCESASVAKNIIQYFNNKSVSKAILLKKIQSEMDKRSITLKLAEDTK